MKWDVSDRKTLYASWFLELHLDLVTLPDGREFRHEVVSVPNDAANLAVADRSKGLLMIYRHRFITDRWGWELPGGMVDPGETPDDTAARECLEETGWDPGPLRKLTMMHPSSGYSDVQYHLFVADEATHRGDPSDINEASTIEWRSFEQVRSDFVSGHIPDGFAQLGVALALGALGEFTLGPIS